MLEFSVIPLSIARWMTFSGKNIPFAVTVFGSVLFYSSGQFNVILFRLTRPKLIPSRARNNSQSVSFSFTVENGTGRRMVTEPVQVPRRMTKSNEFTIDDSDEQLGGSRDVPPRGGLTAIIRRESGYLQMERGRKGSEERT